MRIHNTTVSRGIAQVESHVADVWRRVRLQQRPRRDLCCQVSSWRLRSALPLDEEICLSGVHYYSIRVVRACRQLHCHASLAFCRDQSRCGASPPCLDEQCLVALPIRLLQCTLPFAQTSSSPRNHL